MSLRQSRTWLAAMLVVLCAMVGPSTRAATAQPRPADRPEPQDRIDGPAAQPPPVGIAPAEIQRMLDGYELMQAQETLELGDDQFPRFLPRLKALQDARRRALIERNRVIQELRRMTQARAIAVDEARIRERVKALDDLDARSALEIRQAMEALDQVLDARQQARFRIFEEMMEQRKVELLMRARQANRPQNRPQNRPPNQF